MFLCFIYGLLLESGVWFWLNFELFLYKPRLLPTSLNSVIIRNCNYRIRNSRSLLMLIDSLFLSPRRLQGKTFSCTESKQLSENLALMEKKLVLVSVFPIITNLTNVRFSFFLHIVSCNAYFVCFSFFSWDTTSSIAR